MSAPIFKVIFKGTKNDNDKLNLIFKGITSKKIVFPASIILELKEISKENQNVISFQNISDVLKVEKDTSLPPYNYYYIILCTLKDGTKKGFLIANEKKSGDILIGTWPFNQEFSNEEIIETNNNLIKNLENYKEICIIN
ncbi:MAG: hypothetical protein EU535_05525 [Promethearchaeota archaeon]|nr:MAG: hypothetical protein EU535_05525 [Candidatus Lokiarchaeota archaeon]